MFLTAEKAALAGVTLAVSFILLTLGSVLEVSTLFFLAAAAFCIGIVIRELGLRAGAAFLAASLLLGFFLAPNKLYVVTYGLMESYLLLRELLWVCLEKRKQAYRGLYLAGKFVIFQLVYLPALFLVPRLVYMGETENWSQLLLVGAGEVFWLVADMAYDVFQRQIWGRIRRQFHWTK